MEKIELKIIDLDDNGRGVAKEKDLIYFVENAKLGETLIAEVIKEKKSFKIAKKIKTIVKSPFLEDINIKEKQLCGVFDLYDIFYDKQVEFKKNNIINTINRISNENLKSINFINADKRFEYRNKVELKLSQDGIVSSFSRNSNSFLPSEDCVMVTNEINLAIKKLQELFYIYKIEGYDPVNDLGYLKNIIIRSTSIGETMCIFVINKNKNLIDFYQKLENEKIFDSLYITVNTKKSDYKIKDLVHVFGKTKIEENMGGFKFKISPKAFFQVNTNMAYKMYMIAKSYVEIIKPDQIIDLYSGVSTTSIILSSLANKIISVEINEDAVKDAKENALLNGINNIEWYAMSAEKAIEKIDLKKNNSMALFDPPRRGLDEKIITKIGNSYINNVVYISCNLSTLARDIKKFKEYGFALKEVTGVDQFVNTVEIETIVLLQR